VVPTPPRPAATVVLVRDAPLRVFLQRRVAGMDFAGGMTVFPGGRVDPGDRVERMHWTGPEPQWWAARFGCTSEEAGALVVAAVRETFEECGVLLAGPDPVDEAARDDLVARRRSLPEVLAGRTLRADLLSPWARWVTPQGEPRRYDTAFFVARLPEGQEADARTTEAVEATWWRPTDALEHAGRGLVQLMPPTRHTLEEIADHSDAAAVLAAARNRTVPTHRPVLRREGARAIVVVPGHPELRFDLDPGTVE
jgi:8-oxo-dGTP pyrophosphatase MutT (NUDIX family)